MNTFLPTIVVVAALSLSPLKPAFAQGLSTSFIDISCAKYIEETANSQSHPYNWFVGGFLTGANYVKGRQTPQDASTYRVWLTNYCKVNPFDSFMTALARLDHHLGQGQNN